MLGTLGKAPGLRQGLFLIELAATAAFLALQGEKAPWQETQRRKPDKAAKHLGAAQELYERLQSIPTPAGIPKIKG